MESNDAGIIRQIPNRMQRHLRLTAHEWHTAVGAEILEAVTLKKSLKIICVRPTGGGKCLVFNVVATMLKGVTICICPLLSIAGGADQTRKTLDAIDFDIDSLASLTAFYLDKLKMKSVHLLKTKIRDEWSNATAVIIFAFPQALNGKKGNALIPFLIRRKLILFPLEICLERSLEC